MRDKQTVRWLACFVGAALLGTGCGGSGSTSDDLEPGSDDLQGEGEGEGEGEAPSTSSTESTSTSTDPGEGEGEVGRVANPFVGARYYVNPEYADKVDDSIATSPALATAMAKMKSMPTAVWLDRIAAIEGTNEAMGVEGHMEEALAQAASGAEPVLLSFVVYDLPDRDCAAFASNGELSLAEGGMERYKTEYIDVIADTLESAPGRSKLRVVLIIEPDALPNLVTNLGVYPKCATAAPGYKEGVAYAVSRLSQIDNAYLYLDIAHSGWLGWEHAGNAAIVYKEVLATAGGEALISGFATNVANYSSLDETFDPYVDVNANRDIIEGFYEWNRVIDELTFVDTLRQSFPDKGFIVDTGRSGWASRGANLPLDSRTHRGNWCNVSGAGVGERPRAAPRDGVDAYFWIKPPGESDGTSDTGATSPNDEGKSYDKMCGVAPVVRPYAPGESIPTDALSGAPHAGKWFHAQFEMLVENATPPL